MKKLTVFLFIALCAFAAEGPQPPLIGIARGTTGSIARVLGLPGALTVEPVPDLAGVDAVAFGGRLFIVKRGNMLQVVDATGVVTSETEAPTGAALLAGFSADGNELAVFDGARSVVRTFIAGSWNDIPYNGPANVLAISITAPGELTVAAASEDETKLLTIRRSDGGIRNEAKVGPGAASAALFPSGDLLLIRSYRVAHRTPSGEERELESPADAVNLTPLGPSWATAETATGTRYAIRIKPNLRIMELPEVEQ